MQWGLFACAEKLTFASNPQQCAIIEREYRVCSSHERYMITNAHALFFMPYDIFLTGLLLGIMGTLLFNLWRRKRASPGAPQELMSFLLEATRIAVEVADVRSMTEQLLQYVQRNLRVTKAAFLFMRQHAITDVQALGYDAQDLQKIPLDKIFHIAHAPDLTPEKWLQEEPLKSLFRQIDIALAIPVKMKGEEVGVLILGPKSARTPYSRNEMNMLRIFAQQTGLAIRQAQLNQKLQKFSDEVEQKIFERTAQLEETQRRELGKAHDITRLKDEFVFIAAHELKNPVTAIRGFLELIQQFESAIPKEARNHLAVISIASDHLYRLIEDLLEIARSDAETLRVNVKPTALVPVLELVIKELKEAMAEKHIRVSLHVEEPAPFVLSDSTRLREVATNLLNNAIKYNRPQGTVEIRVLRQDDIVITEFRDTGYGIPKKDQGHIFQKFFRAKTKETEEVLGTGLGLFIVRMLIERMGGKVSFTSVEGRGSTFSFYLPIAQEEQGEQMQITGLKQKKKISKNTRIPQ